MYINDDTVTNCSYIYSCKLNLLRGDEIMEWTKTDDEKLRLLDYYGVTVTDMASYARNKREHLFTVYGPSKRGRQRGVCG